MHAATTRKNLKTAALRWLGATTGLLMGLAGTGAITTGHVLAAVSPITVTVASDATPSDHFEGVSYSSWGDIAAPIATFTDSDACPTTCQPATDYTATVLWGDSSVNTACPSAICTITSTAGTPGSYDVVATHTYKDEFNCMPVPPATTCSNYPVHVRVTDVSDAVGPITGDNIAAGGILVKDQPLALSASPYSFAPTSGVNYSGPIGSFQDANPLAAAFDQDGVTNEYSFSIKWGDGTPPDTSTGTFTIQTCTAQGCTVQINGTHKYLNSNAYKVDVDVNDGRNLRTLTVSSTANVGNDGGTRCLSADLTGYSSSMPAGTPINFKAGAGGCSAPQYQFWLRYGTGSWVVMRPYNTTSTWTWDTSKSLPGAYTIVVWVKQTGASASYETFAAANVSLIGCVGSVTDIPSPNSPQISGTPVQFTATNGSGCPNPIYQFWVQKAPGSSTYTIAQPYSANSSVFNWDTSGKAAGIYNISVWVRQANSYGAYGNSLGRYDAYKVIPYMLTSAPCSAGSITSAPPTTAEVGPQIPITATANCPYPLYQFWLQYMSGAWKIVQPFGINATWNWTTAQALPGAYKIAVWIKDSGASATTKYQTSAGANVTLTGCVGSVSDTPNPPSPRASGTQVVFTASNGSGCTSPRYQFWLQTPGSTTWTDVQPYTSPNGNVFTWTTTGKAAGTYKISVWVKDLNSGGAYGNSLGRYDSYTLISYTLT